jgi:hypothetical protein
MAYIFRVDWLSFPNIKLIKLNGMTPLLVLKNGRVDAIQQVTEALHNAGLQVIPSFDSRRTRINNTDIACPHHGTAVCTCHIVVLLVYKSEEQPATLIVYGQDDDTWVSLAVSPGLRPSAALQAQIKNSLTMEMMK